MLRRKRFPSLVFVALFIFASFFAVSCSGESVRESNEDRQTEIDEKIEEQDIKIEELQARLDALKKRLESPDEQVEDEEIDPKVRLREAVEAFFGEPVYQGVTREYEDGFYYFSTGHVDAVVSALNAFDPTISHAQIELPDFDVLMSRWLKGNPNHLEFSGKTLRTISSSTLLAVFDRVILFYSSKEVARIKVFSSDQESEPERFMRTLEERNIVSFPIAYKENGDVFVIYYPEGFKELQAEFILEGPTLYQTSKFVGEINAWLESHPDVFITYIMSEGRPLAKHILKMNITLHFDESLLLEHLEG